MAMSSNDMMSSQSPRRIPLVRILIGTLAAIVAATVVNVIVFSIGDAAGAFPDDFRFSAPGGETSMGVGNVILTTITYLVFGGVVFAIISRLSTRPVRVFWYVAAVAFVLSLVTPFTIEDAPGDMIAFLLLMHLLAAVIGVWVMTRVATS
ncbi:MAG: DUF6069 family protein [Chloroflexota bacterium]|nr:DUF6069 family protein [Chloroflexota bacterium]